MRAHRSNCYAEPYRCLGGWIQQRAAGDPAEEKTVLTQALSFVRYGWQLFHSTGVSPHGPDADVDVRDWFYSMETCIEAEPIA